MMHVVKMHRCHNVHGCRPSETPFERPLWAGNGQLIARRVSARLTLCDMTTASTKAGRRFRKRRYPHRRSIDAIYSDPNSELGGLDYPRSNLRNVNGFAS
jgi:hypothetical protein